MPDVAEILGEACRMADALGAQPMPLRSPPDPDRPVRSWLRRVATNIVRMRHRGRVRRDAREAVIEQSTEPAEWFQDRVLTQSTGLRGAG
jgi:DNA-directed RNA polymerase specialized sigma24 family protein